MIKTICYGQEKNFETVENATEFYVIALVGSEGAEQERYAHILGDLSMGKTVCTDGVE